MSEEVVNTEIKLVSCDKKEFVVKQKVAFMSELIKQMYNVSSETSQEMMIQDVDGDTLTRVIEFCSYHVDNPMKEIEKPLKSNNMAENVSAWDANFIDLDDTTLYKIVNAANYLMIQPLLDLAYPLFLSLLLSFMITCAKIASYIKGKTTEQIRERFNIQNDFSTDEEQRIRQDNKWANDL